jgi:hypothetical protein
LRVAKEWKIGTAVRFPSVALCRTGGALEVEMRRCVVPGARKRDYRQVAVEVETVLTRKKPSFKLFPACSDRPPALRP